MIFLPTVKTSEEVVRRWKTMINFMTAEEQKLLTSWSSYGEKDAQGRSNGFLMPQLNHQNVRWVY